jgi:hypothetical protein
LYEGSHSEVTCCQAKLSLIWHSRDSLQTGLPDPAGILEPTLMAARGHFFVPFILITTNPSESLRIKTKFIFKGPKPKQSNVAIVCMMSPLFHVYVPSDSTPCCINLLGSRAVSRAFTCPGSSISMWSSPLSITRVVPALKHHWGTSTHRRMWQMLRSGALISFACLLCRGFACYFVVPLILSANLGCT